jgi:hypothetical protein
LLTYAPPGSNNGKNNCQVEYTSGSTAGTTTSISNSFQGQFGVTATVPTAGSSAGDKDNVGFGVSYSTTEGMTNSLDIKKSVSNDLKVPGPATDGIDHSRDRVFLLLYPQLEVVIDPRYNMSWGLNFAGSNLSVVELQMDWLRDLDLFERTEPDLKRRCDQAGMKPQDYAQLLTVNPFANGPAPVDLSRYVLTNIFLPYQPPESSQESVPTASVNLSSTVTNTSQKVSQSTWSMSLSIAATVWSVALKVASSLSWTNSTTKTNSIVTTQTAIAIIGGPSAGYTGPTDLLIWWDTMFDVFMFTFADGPPTQTGTLFDAAGKPLPHTDVQLTVGSQVFYTRTDSKGK